MLARRSTSRSGAGFARGWPRSATSKTCRRLTKRLTGWKAPRVRPSAVAFASDCGRRPYRVAAVFGPWWPGELILQGFRKESSEGLVSGQSPLADVFQTANGIRERQEVSGSNGLG